MNADVRPGMRATADGRSLGRVSSVDAEGFTLDDGLRIPWADLIGVRDGDVEVSAHRPAEGEAAQRAPGL
jgi:hypothetical protein